MPYKVSCMFAPTSFRSQQVAIITEGRLCQPISLWIRWAEENPAQLATGGRSAVAQPQTRSQDTILAILQELRANMQVMDNRVNELSAKVNQMQSVDSADVENTSVLIQNTTSCEVQSTISPTPSAYNATTETESETLRDPECWANSDPNTDFSGLLSLSFLPRPRWWTRRQSCNHRHETIPSLTEDWEFPEQLLCDSTA